MRDSQHGGQGGRGTDEMSALARTVVARLMQLAPRTARKLDSLLVDTIRLAVLAADAVSLDALRPDLRRARVSDADLVDHYCPAVARQLGCDWTDDLLSFTQVSIGMSRLQALVHQIGLDLPVQCVAEGASFLIVLPQGEAHSFGVQVLAGQLRRQGASVHLQIAAQPAGLFAVVQEHHYDCALVSVAGDEKLESCAKVVKSLKEASGGRLCVAVGGAALERLAGLHLLVGADIGTNDPMQALAWARRSRALSGARSRAQSETRAPGKRMEET